ncbi:Ribosome biogenesis protein BRX1 -like protein [Sarcoptes scabiei]|uniref:Ribosome biogenesis protein BRX1 homolog n=1 Tax=Sarcoptes scabiei TaxID=52283 RepID=A0A834R0D1_SARSC|nr:Ribosome biogenesis protein BRX1 -like protein [Sarcoptes scabiei]
MAKQRNVSTKLDAKNKKLVDKKILRGKIVEDQSTTEAIDDVIQLPKIRQSISLPMSLKTKWINKQRVLIVASRGITYRDRHLMNNLKSLMPHSKSESKIGMKDTNTILNEICEIKNCNKCIFFENRKRKDLYVWFANIPNGPTAKFLVENIHTMEELRMTGNCLKSSRPFLSFDEKFEREPHYALIRNYSLKFSAFLNHILKIVDNNGSLVEIGPRFCLNLIKIFDGAFMNRVLYTNPNYLSPNKHRILLKQKASEKYRKRIESKQQRQMNRPLNRETYADLDKYDDVFSTIPIDQAIGAEKLIFGHNG